MVIFEIVAVKVAEADRVINLVFCEISETVLANDAEIDLYIVNAFPIVEVKVAFADRVLYPVRINDTVNVPDADNVRENVTMRDRDAVNVADAESVRLTVFCLEIDTVDASETDSER